MCVCMHVRSYVRSDVRSYVCMHVCTYVCMYVRTYVRMYVVCMYQTGTKGAVTKGAVNKRQFCSKFAGFCFETFLIVQSEIRQI